jgi:hypothetical protein
MINQEIMQSRLLSNPFAEFQIQENEESSMPVTKQRKIINSGVQGKNNA